jgi:hypothetical protein
MLTFNEYASLWRTQAPQGFNQVSPAPSFHEYVLRSIYLQDYIDLFIQVPTFIRVNIGEDWYIEITGNPLLNTLAIPMTSPYCINIGGVDYLKIGYDYPWTPSELDEKRHIKYIMVGEAPRPSEAQTFFYNLEEINNTPWLNAPVDAFLVFNNGNGLNQDPTKKEKLIFLANNGYILLDLFPFAMDDYSPFRNNLNQEGISENFFMNFINRKLRNFQSYNLLADEPILAFSGPGIIHHYLADKISVGELSITPDFITCRAYQNGFRIYSPASENTPPIMIPWPGGGLLNGIFTAGILSQVPYYRCGCYYVGGNYAPHSLLIRNAFF